MPAVLVPSLSSLKQYRYTFLPPQLRLTSCNEAVMDPQTKCLTTQGAPPQTSSPPCKPGPLPRRTHFPSQSEDPDCPVSWLDTFARAYSPNPTLRKHSGVCQQGRPALSSSGPPAPFFFTRARTEPVNLPLPPIMSVTTMKDICPFRYLCRQSRGRPPPLVLELWTRA